MLMKVHQRNRPNPAFHKLISTFPPPSPAAKKGYLVFVHCPAYQDQHPEVRNREEVESSRRMEGQFEVFGASLGYRNPGSLARRQLGCVLHGWNEKYSHTLVAVAFVQQTFWASKG